MKLVKSIILVVILVFLSSCSSENSKHKNLKDGIYADIETNVGDILVKLEYKKTPLTVANFISLAEGTNPVVIDSMRGRPFYDGLMFHSVVSKANGDSGDFMIQSGCPLNSGMGTPGYSFPDEFPKDKDGNLLLNFDTKGVIAMANFGENINGSQFFINLVPTPHLNGVNTVFGKVSKGFHVARDSVRAGTKIKTIQIIKVGSDAKGFDAPKVFLEKLDASKKSKEELAAKVNVLKKAFLEKIAVYEKDATETSSGLKFYLLKEGKGPKPGVGADIRIHYSVFFTDGSLLDTNRKEVALEYGTYNKKRDEKNGYRPFSSTYSMDEQLIQGFKEGLQKMKFGDRALLFIPYYLAYGESGGRGIPPKSDLIFELEMYPKEAK